MEHSSTASGKPGTAGESGAQSRYEDKARAQLDDLADRARREAENTADAQKHRAADTTHGVADAMRRSADRLDEQQQPLLAGYASDLASGLDRIADTLREKDINTLVGQSQDFARRQPAVYLGGAVATGFLLARFLKSSSERGHASDTGQSHSTGGRADGATQSRTSTTASRG